MSYTKTTTSIQSVANTLEPLSSAMAAALRHLSEQAQTLPAALAEQAAAVIRDLAAADDATSEAAPDKVKLASPFVGGIGPREIVATLGEIGGHMAANPTVMMAEAGRFLREVGRVFTQPLGSAAQTGDRRFKDESWRHSPLHNWTMHSYLAWSTALDRVIDRAGAGTEATQRMRYVASLFTDAMSPDNALLGNPAALKLAAETGGASLVEGMRNLLKDLADNNASPAQVDKGAFAVGRTLAATPGAVVFRNDVLELIHYRAQTPTVHVRPIMMIPPVVNKYYLLDLAPGRSVAEYLVQSGFSVFMVSWRNPEPAHRDWGLESYVCALLQGLDAVAAITGSPDVNLFTVCTGVVPMAALMGVLAGREDRRVASATMVVSVLDSHQGRSLGLFATPDAIAAAKRRSWDRGVLDGEDMARTFTWMRPKDLVWTYWVNNYLLGKQPPAHDVLFWNNDPTRLPARLHGEILDIYGDDALTRPGGLTVLGVPIDLSRVGCECYMVGGMTDHISVWKGVYASARHLGGPFEFVLHSSGHIQSVVNPPGLPKARYFVNPAQPKDPDEWLAEAQSREGSWWTHWRDWLGQRSGELDLAPDSVGGDGYPPLAPAPGGYVLAG